MKRILEVSPGFYIMAAAAVLILPLRILVAAAFAAWFHEGAHLAVLHFFKIPVDSIRLGAGGARIMTGPMLPVQELLCAAAGPLASLSLLLFLRCFPVLALFGLIQGLFNLLPVFPLDGGRILRAFWNVCFSDSGCR